MKFSSWSPLASSDQVDLNALKGPAREYEVLCKGNLIGMKRELVVFSCYLPPGIPGREFDKMMEALTDAITEAKSKADSLWIILGGDFNRYDTTVIERTVPDLTKVESEPTRGDATLDLSLIHI